MSNGEIAYLALAIGAFFAYGCLLAYGMAAASERPAASGAKPARSDRNRIRKAA